MSEESSIEITFEASEGEVSDIEDSSTTSPPTSPASYFNANVLSPIIGTTTPQPALNSPLNSSGSSTMPTAPSTVTLVDGYKVKVAAAPKNIDANTEYVQISSEERVKLTQKEQAEIRNTITKKQHSLYEKMDLSSTDIKQLVGFQTNLVSTERHFAKFDLRQVFMIVEPDRDPDGNILSTLKNGSTQRSLFQCYAVVKLDEVIASNSWWNKHTEDDWINENMGLTYEYLKSHTSPALWMKISEQYDNHKSEVKGGPLFLFLMIRHLMADNESISVGLASKIDGMRISSYKGEDVGEVITHLRGIVQRLKNMRRRDKSGTEIDLVPFDLSERLYKVFQTSSNSAFNRFFASRYEKEYGDYLLDGPDVWTDPDKILILAGNLYTKLCSENKWVGQEQDKATFPSFKSAKAASAFIAKTKCHNCGGEHFLRDCTEPKDQARIDANQKKMKAARKLAKKDNKEGKGRDSKSGNGNAPGGKFPEKPAKGQSNKCTVDGKEYYFHFKSHRWLPVDKQKNATSSTPVAAPATTNQQSTTTGNVMNPERNLSLSLLANQLQECAATLSNIGGSN
jgi:hypothetical protein